MIAVDRAYWLATTLSSRPMDYVVIPMIQVSMTGQGVRILVVLVAARHVSMPQAMDFLVHGLVRPKCGFLEQSNLLRLSTW